MATLEQKFNENAEAITMLLREMTRLSKQGEFELLQSKLEMLNIRLDILIMIMATRDHDRIQE